jgi:molecular chaperone DnaK (HSP70)
MTEEAAMYRQQDNLIKARIEAKNNLENYVYSLRNTLQDSTVRSNLNESDKKILEDAVQETLRWLELNADVASKNEFDERQKRLHNLCREVLNKTYRGTGMSLLPEGPLKYVYTQHHPNGHGLSEDEFF